jgi:hypothetical protein
MGSDPRLGIPYPESTATNDVPRDIKAVVDKIGPIMAVDLQGTLAARPAAGVRGRYYNATDDALFRDNGTAWVQVTAAPDKTYTPAWTRIPDSNPSFTISVTPNAGFAEYVVDGAMCWVNVHQLLTFNGGTASSSGVNMSLPVTPKSPAGISAEGQNSPLHQSLDATGVKLYVGDWHSGSLWQMNAQFWFRITGWYRVLGTVRTA